MQLERKHRFQLDSFDEQRKRERNGELHLRCQCQHQFSIRHNHGGRADIHPHASRNSFDTSNHQPVTRLDAFRILGDFSMEQRRKCSRILFLRRHKFGRERSLWAKPGVKSFCHCQQFAGQRQHVVCAAVLGDCGSVVCHRLHLYSGNVLLIFHFTNQCQSQRKFRLW